MNEVCKSHDFRGFSVPTFLQQLGRRVNLDLYRLPPTFAANITRGVSLLGLDFRATESLYLKVVDILTKIAEVFL